MRLGLLAVGALAGFVGTAASARAAASWRSTRCTWWIGERSLALGKGYTTILTDTGHIGDGVSASWTRLADGKPDMVKRVDFFYRAAHDVTVAGKAFAETYYAAKVEHAYFDGCSTGGRMAMIEADRYPEDHQGVIAGDPLLSNITSAARAVVQKAAVSSPAAYTPKPRLQRSTRG
jgi:hypothetical protein